VMTYMGLIIICFVRATPNTSNDELHPSAL
jgi:hypothetical protein